MSQIQDLARILDRHSAALGDGTHDNAIPRVALIRSEHPTDRLHTVYRPSVCIVAQGRTAQITKAIRWIAARFLEPINIEDAAAVAGMSASAFYHHFKAVTALSPLQYQKQLRLQEARRLLVSEGSDATTAAFAVGYSSSQQFTREYARLFGAPPQRDVTRLRAETIGARIAAPA